MRKLRDTGRLATSVHTDHHDDRRPVRRMVDFRLAVFGQELQNRLLRHRHDVLSRLDQAAFIAVFHFRHQFSTDVDAEIRADQGGL